MSSENVVVEGSTSSSFASTSTAEHIPNKTGHHQTEEKFASVDLSATSLPPSEKRNPLSHELKQSLEHSIIKVSLRSEDFHKKELILDVHSSLASGKEFLAVRSTKDFDVFLQLLDQEFLSSLVIPTLLPANKISLHNQLGISSFVKPRETKPLSDVDAARPYQLLLEHIVDHSVLRYSDAVWDFLTCTEEQWAKAPSQIIQLESAQKLQSAASKGILFSLKKFATVEKANPEEEKLIQYAKQIAFTTNYFLEHLKQYCKAQYELQDSMDIVGREFKIWGNKYEQDAKEDYDKWHSTGDRIIEMFKKGDEWLIDYKNNLRIMLETIVYFYEQSNTLQKYIYSRSERQADLNIVGAEYKSKLAELQKLKEKNPNLEAIQPKLKQLEESIAVLKHDIDRLQVTLNAIKQHQMQEFLLFRQQFQHAYQKCLTLAVQTQAHFAEGVKSVLNPS